MERGERHNHQQHHELRSASRRRLVVVLAMSATFLVVEVVGAFISNSLALLADAGHTLGDVGAVSLALFALWFGQRPATPQRTFGYARAEILAAFLNALALLLVVAYVLWEAWHRFWEPAAVHGVPMLIVAVAGLGVNLVAIKILAAGRRESLNVEGAFLHVLGDALGSVGAIVAAVVILTTGFYAADAIISVMIAAVIVWSAWNLLRRTVAVLMEGTPPGIDLLRVRDRMLAVPGVRSVHDLHVWALTSGFIAMSGHVVAESPERRQELLPRLHEQLHDEFDIAHTTLQIESEEEEKREQVHCVGDPRCLPPDVPSDETEAEYEPMGWRGGER